MLCAYVIFHSDGNQIFNGGNFVMNIAVEV
jgi:hypothetical protein